MYAFIIIETENEIQARIARIFLEAAGYPSIAATVEVVGERHSAYLVAAPADVPRSYEPVIRKYALLGEHGVELAEQSCAHPAVKLFCSTNPRQVSIGLRDTVRNSLLHTLYTAAEEEASKVVFCEPAYSSVPAHVVDAPTAPVTRPLGEFTAVETPIVTPDGRNIGTEFSAVRNSEGGGFDGQCRGADRWHDHDSGDEHPRPHFSA